MTAEPLAYQVYGGQSVELTEYPGTARPYVLRVNGAERQRFEDYELALSAFSVACDETVWGQLSIFKGDSNV